MGLGIITSQNPKFGADEAEKALLGVKRPRARNGFTMPTNQTRIRWDVYAKLGPPTNSRAEWEKISLEWRHALPADVGKMKKIAEIEEARPKPKLG